MRRSYKEITRKGFDRRIQKQLTEYYQMSNPNDTSVPQNFDAVPTDFTLPNNVEDDPEFSNIEELIHDACVEHSDEVHFDDIEIRYVDFNCSDFEDVDINYVDSNDSHDPFTFYRDFDEFEVAESSLANDLRKWVKTENIAMRKVNSLLRLLKQHGHSSELPADYRTLMKTPRHTSRKIQATNGGLYAHFDVERSIIKALSQHCDTCPASIDLLINCDGISFFGSSRGEMWPILFAANVNGIRTNPFIVGAHFGKSKPHSANLFMQKTVLELKNIVNTGLKFKGGLCNVHLKAIICDSPARSFITYTKHHSGYFSCTKCEQEGEYVDHVILPELDSALRTDESFRLQSNPQHHTGVSFLENLGIGMVSQIALDYMHLVCLGVAKKLLSDLVRGPKNIRLNGDVQQRINDKLLTYNGCYPWEISRHMRPLNEFTKFKATEFRLFLLYIGPIVLKNNVSEEYYEHFLNLSLAIRILCDSEKCLEMNEVANSLLRTFVEQYKNYNGVERLTYNIHNLIHLANEVKQFGSLNNFSCFPFENYLRMLKLKIKPGPLPMQQLVNRLSEEEQMPLEKVTKKKIPNYLLW